MREVQRPYQEQQPPRQAIKFSISKDGKIDFEGDMSQEQTQQVLSDVIQQAEYYRQKSAQLEQEKIKRSTEIDGVIVVFASCMMLMFIFATYTVVTGISSLFNQPTEIKENVRINL